MKPTVWHLALAACFSLAILALAFLPAELVAMFGCRNRGLWAILLALTSGMLGLVTAALAIGRRLRGQKSNDLALAGLAYALPLVLLLWLA